MLIDGKVQQFILSKVLIQVMEPFSQHSTFNVIHPDVLMDTK
jgi:hypothetical protein